MESFSTFDLPASRKISYWNELTSETFAQAEIRAFDASQFDARLNRARLGPVSLIDVRCSAVRVQRTRAHIARTAMPSYLLVTPLRGEFELRLEHSPAIRVRAGQFCLIDHARPYEFVHGYGVHTLCVDVPRPAIEERICGADRLVGRVMTSESTMSRLLMGLLFNLGRELSSTKVTDIVPAFGHTLLGFIAATYSSELELPVGRGTAARARAYRAYIDSRITEPELRPADVAHHFGISERYLRSVLSADGEPFSSYVLRRRLKHCARRLADPESRWSTITAIAFEAGFSNATHFAQAFKAHYGLAPREYRKVRP
jgi:AraC-like DNA-binding protein